MTRNDPHVVSLTYNVEPRSGICFNDPPPLEKERAAYTLRLVEEVLTVSMKEHHATEESARACVEPYLRAWEITSGLHRGRPTITFRFVNSEIIDRNPSPRDGHILTVECGSYVLCGGEVNFTIGMGRYPEPPEQFLATDDVKVMWARYSAYVEGREPLQSMAYACLSLLEGT